MTKLALVLNSGSSSIKFQILDAEGDTDTEPLISGLVERIGEDNGAIVLKVGGEKYEIETPIADHTEGLSKAFDLMTEHNVGPTQLDLVAVGHRVVHGGQLFSTPVLIDDQIQGMIEDLIPLAPLHNPAHVAGIKTAREILPNLPHVAVFDTGFFYDLPPAAAVYALNKEVASEHGVRRYGFHGTSHEFVSKQTPALLGKDLSEINQITFHLGNGASVSAVSGGRAVDTSMGMTPLAGLMMGTRTGDIDPGVVFHLYRNGLSIDEIDTIFNKKSGLKGICGANDFREINRMIADDDPDAWLAYNIYIHQLRRYLGSYMIPLGHVDAINFTAGVGENVAQVRADVLKDLEAYGIKIDPERNENNTGEARLISTDDSTVKVFVIPTNEELAIAQYALELTEK
ncbi:acetate kinase [Corynebacterium ulceribovis]|uniref:acetate kinase n=1 Tax=Corynebacterium ulceribovis TaxID=487732 RepID=UPI00035F3A9F|nr:acetate kinase [Corynebacterium ulceribovis]